MVIRCSLEMHTPIGQYRGRPWIRFLEFGALFCTAFKSMFLTLPCLSTFLLLTCQVLMGISRTVLHGSNKWMLLCASILQSLIWPALSEPRLSYCCLTMPTTAGV